MCDIKNIDGLCLSGGGDKAFSIIGCLSYLEKYEKFDITKINNYYGTSAGAILSFLLIIGYTIDEIKDFIEMFDFKLLFNAISTNIIDFLNKFGFDDASKIINIIKKFLQEKINIDDITFIDLFKITCKKLNIIGTNFSKGTDVIFNHINNPNMSVITAINISMCIPLLFQPILYEGDYYVDGGITNNLPIKYCNKKTTLIIYLKFGHNNNLNSVIDLLVGCTSIMCDVISEKDFYDKSLNIIQINNDINNIIFDLTKENKIKIIQNGYDTAELFIKNIPNKICKFILDDIINKI